MNTVERSIVQVQTIHWV